MESIEPKWTDDTIDTVSVMLTLIRYSFHNHEDDVISTRYKKSLKFNYPWFILIDAQIKLEVLHKIIVIQSPDYCSAYITPFTSFMLEDHRLNYLLIINVVEKAIL